MMRTLSSPGSATELNVKELPEGEAEAAPSDEGASASDVRSMIASSTFMEDALAVAGADFPKQGIELDNDPYDLGLGQESRCLCKS